MTPDLFALSPQYEAPYSRGRPIIHVGCTLGYHVTAPTPASFLIQPLLPGSAAIVEESLFIDSGATLAHGVDAYGNRTLTTTLIPGANELRYGAIVDIGRSAEHEMLPRRPSAADAIPPEVLRYTLPSRYCESDKLTGFAHETFGHVPRGVARAQAICHWVAQHIEYRYGSGSPTLSACEAMQRGYGVCRDFAHVLIALCRAADMPARYVAGYIPLMPGNEVEGDSDIGTDFHAYAEVYAGGRWRTFDARYMQPLAGRIKIAHGMDAVDAAFATFYGNVEILKCEAWARQVSPAIETPFSASNAMRVHHVYSPSSLRCLKAIRHELNREG